MMKRFLKVISLFTAALLLLSLAACAVPAPNPTQGTTTVPTTTTQTDPPPTTEPADTPKKLTIMVCNNATSANILLDFNKRELSNVWEDLKEMLDNRGLEIEWIIVAEEDYDETLSDVLTGKAEVMPDAVWLGDTPVTQKVTAIEAGLLTPLEDILPYSDGTAAKFFDMFPEYHAANAYNGKLWWFGEHEYPTYNGKATSMDDGSIFGLTVRQDWLNALDTAAPRTIEELESYIKACQTQNINGNANKAEYLTGSFRDITGALLNNLYGVPNHHFAVNLLTKKIDTPWTAPETKEMLKTLLRWLELGYIDEEMIGADSLLPWLEADQCAARYQLFSHNYYTTIIDSETRFDAQQIGVVPDTAVHPNAYIPRLPVGKTPHMDMAFTSALSSKRAAAELLDLLLSEEFETLMEWGTENSTYLVIDGKKTRLYGNPSSEEGLYITTGSTFLSRGILPWIRQPHDLYKEDESNCYTKQVHDAYKDAKELPVIYCSNSQNFLAVPTPEESHIIDVYEDNFITLSQSIFQSILRGEIDIDTQWESHVLTPLREAGMDLLTEVYQARVDRYFQ